MRRAHLTLAALAAWVASAPAIAWAQNSPPKPDSDCGLTEMCPRDPAGAAHGHAPSWVVALVMLALVAALLAVAYRAIVARLART